MDRFNVCKGSRQKIFSLHSKYQTFPKGPVDKKKKRFFFSTVSPLQATVTPLTDNMRWKQPHQVSNMFRHA